MCINCKKFLFLVTLVLMIVNSICYKFKFLIDCICCKIDYLWQNVINYVYFVEIYLKYLSISV